MILGLIVSVRGITILIDLVLASILSLILIGIFFVSSLVSKSFNLSLLVVLVIVDKFISLIVSISVSFRAVLSISIKIISFCTLTFSPALLFSRLLASVTGSKFSTSVLKALIFSPFSFFAISRVVKGVTNVAVAGAFKSNPIGLSIPVSKRPLLLLSTILFPFT